VGAVTGPDGACVLVSNGAVQTFVATFGLSVTAGPVRSWCWDAYGAAPFFPNPAPDRLALLLGCPLFSSRSKEVVSLGGSWPMCLSISFAEDPAISLYPAALPSCHSFFTSPQVHILRSSFLIQSFLLFLFREIFGIVLLPY
jgi:hypothetical protein